MSLPAELVFGSTGSYHNQEIASYSDYADMLKERMQYAHEIARKHMSSAAVRSKEFYDAKISLNRYKTGDLVWCLQESRKVGIMTKLQHTYEGPFLIKNKVSEINFLLQLDTSGMEKLVHHNKLKPYESNHPPKWLAKLRMKVLRDNRQ